MSTCTQCGQDHNRLSIYIRGDKLQRRFDSKRHLLRMAGGSIGFLADLLDKHPEVQHFEVTDSATGQTYYTDRSTFIAHGFRQNLGFGLQVILALSHWQTSPLRSQPSTTFASQVQPIVTQGALPLPNVHFEKAKKPRPRLPLRRGH